MQELFTVLIGVQFLVILLHDLVEIPGWTHARQMRAVLGTGKLVGATLANAVYPGIAIGLAIAFWMRPAPLVVSRYWVIYCGVTVVSAIAMWYVPYFRGATGKIKEDYARFYAGTRHWLPTRGDNPRPNALHLIFHVLFVVTLGLAVAVAIVRH